MPIDEHLVLFHYFKFVCQVGLFLLRVECQDERQQEQVLARD